MQGLSLDVGSCNRLGNFQWYEYVFLLWACGSSGVLSSSLSISLEVFLSFRHGEGDEEGRGGGAADEEGHAARDEGDEGRWRER